ncbi:hypothetical protein NAEGRDRAFT_80574 [Naegleria gruberi]|uniref:Uncharacterized protein AM47 n=1 Tax=Naegleria gruberi TaxID=5762 RepID=D2VMS4_NAEGR|nr:uncharacterized protein NAEGRDRAFT_80574 [Naegleria gruberi]EFC41785.1 hypothetical protein NAEGRDRAFT_80574 [Naegleria gruberi]|eukprot:XP_002674529.1 hypothetical protein NAEGRDRAFT_80574 [Naegleria gruberi strain NEG-M]
MGNEVTKLSPEELKNRQIQKVDMEMSRKMQKGSRYNMKVLLKGDRNSGKTMLFRRLQGQPFSEAYIPSTAISTAHVHWNYKASDDTVVVEVWDVVDKGKLNGITNYEDAVIDEEDNQPTPEQLQLKAQAMAKSTEYEVEQLKKKTSSPAVTNSPNFGDHQLTVIDANIVDVYKHCNAVLLVFDITKPWTWEYVKNEIENKVPEGVEIAVIANCKDLENKRVVTQNEVTEFCARRGVFIIECSGLNCYGLKEIYTWLNIPFLKLKIDITKKQLNILEEELQFGKEEVDLYLKTSNYANHLQSLKEKKKATSGFTEELANRKVAVKRPTLPPSTPPPSTNHTALPQASQVHRPPTTTTVQHNTPDATSIPHHQPQPQTQSPVPPQVRSAQPTTPQSATPTPKTNSGGGGFFSAALSYFGGSSKETPKPQPPKAVLQPVITESKEKVDINNFYAGNDDEDAFYSDEGEQYASTNVTTSRSMEDEEDSPSTKPKKKTTKKSTKSKKSTKKSKKVESEDEEEEEDEDFRDRPMIDQSVNESMEELYVPVSKQSFKKSVLAATTSSPSPKETPKPEPVIVKKEIPTLSKEEIAVEDDNGFYSEEEETKVEEEDTYEDAFATTTDTNTAPVTTQEDEEENFYGDEIKETSMDIVPETNESFYDDEEEKVQEEPVEPPKPAIVSSPVVQVEEQKPEEPKQSIFSQRSYYEEEEEKPKKKKSTKKASTKKSSAETSEEKPKKKKKKPKAPAAEESQPSVPTGYEEI